MLDVPELRVSAVQSNIVWEKVNANLEHLQNLVLPLSGSTDLIVLPEMFTTGFTMNPSPFSLKNQNDTIFWMKKMASTVKAAICGSIIFQENNAYYNRFIFIDELGETIFYDKLHLFSYAGEHKNYNFGEKRTTFSYKGWKILPQICYDLRFPETARNFPDTYDLLIYVANFPSVRQYAWDHLLIARAIENQSFTVGVNRTGMDGNRHYYSGGSVILSYDGKPLIHAGNDEKIIQHILNLEDQISFRSQFPFLQDIKHFG